MQLDATGKVNYALSGCAYTADAAAKDDPVFDLSVYLPAALANWNFASVQLGVPFAASTTLMFYNKTLLDGLTLQPPETFEDIAALKNILDQHGFGDMTVYAAMPDTPSLANWLGQMGSFVVDMKNGSEGTAKTLDCVANGALLRFLTAWKQLYASGALENTAGSIDAFAAGNTLLYTASTSHIARLISKIDGAFELGAAYYPRAVPDAAFGATVSGSSLVMFDKGDDSRKAAAREVVLFLTGAGAQSALGAATGYIPCREDALETESYRELLREYPQYAVGLEQLMDTPQDMCSVTVGPAKDFYYAIQDGCSAMLEDDLSPQEAADLLASELQGLLDQYALMNP